MFMLKVSTAFHKKNKSYKGCIDGSGKEDAISVEKDNIRNLRASKENCVVEAASRSELEPFLTKPWTYIFSMSMTENVNKPTAPPWQ